MAIDPVPPVTIDSTPVPQANPGRATSKNAAAQPPSDPVKGTPVPGDQVLLSGNPAAKYQELQHKNEQSRSAAGAIRSTDRSLEALGQKVDALKAPLQAIVKNFPPFAPEDMARMKLFMKYASLRKEIEQLTVPAPPEVVKARKAEALPPPLPADANDSQIADHIEKLDATGASLNGTRAGLAADTAALVHDGRFTSLFFRPNGAQTAFPEVSLTESGAQQKSAHVGQQFATVVSQGVTASSQFLKGLS